MDKLLSFLEFHSLSSKVETAGHLAGCNEDREVSHAEYTVPMWARGWCWISTEAMSEQLKSAS